MPFVSRKMTSGQVLWIEAPRGASSQTGSQLLFSESHPPPIPVVSWWDVVGLLKAEREATQPQVPDEHVEGAPEVRALGSTQGGTC